MRRGCGRDGKFAMLVGGDHRAADQYADPARRFKRPSKIGQSAHPSLLWNSESVMYYHTTMASAKVAITIPSAVLKRVDALVKRRVFPNRSKAIQHALDETLERMDRGRLARECAKLD